MKSIIRIARLELSALFFSPVAWLALIIFIVQSGIDFAGPLQTWARYQEMSEKLTTVTTQIYTNPIWGLFSMVQGNLYLYIPLLTMGLISRELHSGSIKLLLSSPVTIPEIVFGKFLAMMAYGLVLLSVLIFCAAAGIFFIKSADIKLLVSGLLGLYMLICAYSAIGLFMSSLTSYQVVAAISTFVIFAALNYIGNIGQTINFVKDITWFLSISGRSGRMISGLISTKDLFYFIIVIFLFLGLAILKLKGSRESISFQAKAGRYALLVSSLLLLGYFTSRPYLTGYFDMTATQLRTLTPGSRQVVKNMHKPLKIHTYVNMLDANFYYGLPGLQNSDEDFFEQYQRFLPDVSIDYTYYYDSSRNDRLFKNNRNLPLRDLAKRSAHSADLDFKLVLTPAAMRQRIDLSAEEHRFVRELEYGDNANPDKNTTQANATNAGTNATGISMTGNVPRRTFLRMFDDPQKTPDEAEISAALKRLTVTPPKIAFLTGNNERSIDRAGDKEYKMAARELTFRYSLINQGFDLINLPLSPANNGIDGTNSPNGASNIDGTNIDGTNINGTNGNGTNGHNNANSPNNTRDINGIDNTNDIPKDITAIVIADPKTPFTPEERARLTRYLAAGGNMLIAGEPGRQDILNPLLDSLGVQISQGTILQKSQDFAPDFIRTPFAIQAPGVIAGFERQQQEHSIVAMAGAAGLTWNQNKGFTPHPVLVTDQKTTWTRPGNAQPDTGKLVFNPALGDDPSQATLALALTRTVGSKQQKIMILGDADCLSNAELARHNVKTANFTFIVEMFRWFSDGQFPIDTKRPESPDNKLLITRDGITLLRWVLLGIIPAILLIGASILLIKRIRR